MRLILDRLDKPESLIAHVADRPGHDRRYAIDNGKITGELGWVPAYTFERGMEETIRWYLDNGAWVEHVTSGAYQSITKRCTAPERAQKERDRAFLLCLFYAVLLYISVSSSAVTRGNTRSRE